jgi:putative tricarboxylic transport membrane protein
VKDWKDSIKPILRGTFVGYLVGILPGGGGVISTFISYTIEKKLAKHPERFGKGAIEGVAGPESANNASSSANFIPLMTLGIPTNSVMAIILAALLINGLQPGPLLIKNNPSLFWGVIVSMYVGNVMLLILNLPLIKLWIRLLTIPYSILFPSIFFLCLVGSYAVNSNIVEVFIMVIFGIFGYLMRKFEYEPALLVMGFVLCPLAEGALIRSLRMSEGDPLIFFSRPISLVFMAAAILLLILSLFRKKSPLNVENI